MDGFLVCRIGIGALIGYEYVSDIGIVQEFSDWVADMLIKYNWIKPDPYGPREIVPAAVGTIGTAILGGPLTEKIISGLYKFFSGRDAYKIATQRLDSVSLEAERRVESYKK